MNIRSEDGDPSDRGGSDAGNHETERMVDEELDGDRDHSDRDSSNGGD